MREKVSFVLGFAILALQSVALAQEADPAEARRAEARELTGKGDEAFAVGRCDKAVPLWKEAVNRFHAPTILLRIARCQALLGNVVAASDTLASVVAEKLEPGALESFVDAQKQAAAELPGMRARLAHLRVDVGGAFTATPPIVEIDDAQAEAGHPVDVNPGAHRVIVRVNEARYDVNVTIGEGESRTVSVGVRSEQPPRPVPVQKYVGYTLSGVGVVSMIVGGAFGFSALKTSRHLDSVCGADCSSCPSDSQSEISSNITRALVADLTIFGGAALTVAGAIVIFTAPSPKKEAPRLRFVPMGAGVQMLGAFLMPRVAGFVRRVLGPVSIAATLLLGAALGCEELAHVSDYQVGHDSGFIDMQPDAAYSGLCTACAGVTGDLRHAPCPGPAMEAGAADGGTDQTYVFAWRRISVGTDPTTWKAPTYNQGLDQDCSGRPNMGLPAWCAPIQFDSGLDPTDPLTIPPGSWVGLPHGIDNALGERVLGPLVAYSGGSAALDVDGTLSDDFEKGNTGELVIIENWNGLPDDNDVVTRFAGSSGTKIKPAVWDGNDQWIPNAPVASYVPFKSYVVGGVLVADTRAVGEDDTTISVTDSSGKPLTFTLQGRLMVRIATLTPTTMTMYTAGRWNLNDALGQQEALVAFLSGGSMGQAFVIRQNLPVLLRDGADLPLAEQATPGLSCASISFGITSTTGRAMVAD